MPKTLFKFRRPVNGGVFWSRDWTTFTPWYRKDRTVARYIDLEVERIVDRYENQIYTIVMTTIFIGPLAIIYAYSEKT